MATTAVEKSKTRSDLAQLAGVGPFSLLATVAGVLVGYATFALLVAGAGAVLERTDSDIDVSAPWQELTTSGGILLGALLFVSYLLGGYVAGRMGWRRGWLHGLAVFAGSVLIVGAVGWLVRTLANPDDIERISEAVRGFGLPTTREEWREAGSTVGLVSLGGVLLGSLIGGVMGERWFTKVTRRALDAEVDLRERMEASNERLAPVAAGRRTGNGNGNGHGGQTDEADDLDDLSKEELYHLAQEEDIPGRSQMTKDELKEALQKQH
jgi:hypothetical protein